MELQIEKVTGQGRFWAQVNGLAKEAFPPEEYLAPDELLKMAREDHFDFWALTDQGAFVGFMVVKTFKSLAYLFFLAIEPALRGQGYGGRAIETLKSHYPDYTQIVDFEMPEPQAPNAAQRERRRAFYLRSGYQETGLFLRYLGVNYEVFCMNGTFEADVFREMMSTLRIDGFHPVYFTR